MNSRSPKILFLTPGCFDKGGISRYSRYQTQALRDLFGSDQVRVLSLLGPAPDGFESEFAVTWHGRGSRASLIDRFAFSVASVRQVLAWQPDVVHCAHVNLSPLVSRLASLCNAKTILNVYGLELWSGLSEARVRGMRRMNYVIADCHDTASHVRNENLHRDEPAVIWDCADLNRFTPGPVDPKIVSKYRLPDPREKRIVLTLGRLSESARHKGYDRLIEIFGRVLDRIPSAHLVIAGQGNDKQRLIDKVHSYELSSSVTFCGPVDEDDLAAFYCAGHVFCLVSDKGPGRGEGIPLTPIEAMASGLPVVVGDEDGSRELIDQNRNGIVVSPRNLHQMCDALVALLAESDDLHRFRAAEARHVAEERFGYAAFVEKHAALYRDIAATTQGIG